MTKYILVVDDHLQTASAVAATIEGVAAHRCLHVTNGKAALAQLRRHPEACAVILELSLPVMNGFELMDALQQDAKLAHIPVVVFTTMPPPFGEEIGARAVLRKPASPGVLKDTLRRCCSCGVAANGDVGRRLATRRV